MENAPMHILHKSICCRRSRCFIPSENSPSRILFGVRAADAAAREVIIGAACAGKARKNAMKLKADVSLPEFLRKANLCEGDVFFETPEGDCLNIRVSSQSMSFWRPSTHSGISSVWERSYSGRRTTRRS